MDQPRIYVYCPESETPVSGVAWLYRHVDILNSKGFDAVIVHQKEGFELKWHPNQTPVEYHPVSMRPELDVAVFPEVAGPRINEIARDIRKVILVQNAYYALSPTTLGDARPLPYTSPSCLGAIVTCEDSGDYLRQIYPNLAVHRLWCSVDLELYYPRPKKKQICLRPRKNVKDAEQVLRILYETKALRDWSVVIRDPNKDEGRQAEAVRESMIYLNFDSPEGFAWGIAEAMRAGCVVIGYDGRGGAEIMKEKFSYSVSYGDVLEFAVQVGAATQEYNFSAERLEQMGRAASDFIMRNYSQARYRESVVNCWMDILGSGASRVL
jgi:hypothetical protein